MAPYLQNDDILVINDDRWHAPQRVRHKMPLAWARAGNRVLWIEQTPYPNHLRENSNLWRRSTRPHLENPAERFCVGSMPPAFPRMARGGTIGNALRSLHRPWDIARIRNYMKSINHFNPRLLVLFQQPARHDLIDHLPHQLSIYYCNDLFGYGQASPAMFQEEKKCCERVDLVFCTSEILRERLAPYNPATFTIPHAVDPLQWSKHSSTHPDEYKTIAPPRAVFTGVCSERIDLELLNQTAHRLPHWNFILVGPVQRIENQAKQLNERNNIHFLGGKKPALLPAYIASADALIFPYRHDELQRHVGLPIKFYEYLMSGHPIVSTRFTAFEGAPEHSVYFAENANEWSETLEEIRTNPEREQQRAPARIALARENSYDARIALQSRILDALERK